jgi:hypothetical protein
MHAEERLQLGTREAGVEAEVPNSDTKSPVLCCIIRLSDRQIQVTIVTRNETPENACTLLELTAFP